MDKNKKKTKINKHILFLLIILASVFLFTSKVQAATIYPSPSSGSYNVGDNFSIGVFVSSADQAMNAVSGTLSFPADKLEVTSVSRNGSVVNLWVQEPSYFNNTGKVNFEGIVLNPGYSGSAGRVITVNFKTKGPGTANVIFSSGSILANDGQGTSILSGMGSASFAIDVPVSGPVAPDAETPAVTAGTLAGPQITSTTHPDPDSWYPVTIPEFNWDLPTGTTAARLLVGKKPQASPNVSYVPAIASKNLDAMDDGIWYFHVQLRNASGWGGVTHFRFQIDTQDPEYFNMEQVEEEDLTNPIRSFILDAKDATSGISHYVIQIDDNDAIEWQDDGEHTYRTPVLGPGKHTIIINALDKAGNFLTNVDDFVIEPLTAPTITDYSKELTNKDPFVIKGTSYLNSQVVIWLQREATEPQSYIVKTDEAGKFTFVAEEKLRDGIYQIWAEVIDERGARSEASQKYKVLVQPTKLWQIGNTTIGILSIIIPLIALISLLIFVMWFSWHRLSMLRVRVRREAGEAQLVLHKEFKSLKRRLSTHITSIEKTGKKRKLTKEEQRLVKQLKKELDLIEDKIEKEIVDIQKEVK
jgi:hypothetical protein